MDHRDAGWKTNPNGPHMPSSPSIFSIPFVSATALLLLKHEHLLLEESEGGRGGGGDVCRVCDTSVGKRIELLMIHLEF